MPYRPDAPYKQSRSVLRQIYGARAIDASAPQSSRDMTPSGRIKYLEQSRGYNPDEADFADKANFENRFMPRPPGFMRPQDKMNSPWVGVTATGPAAPLPEAATRPMTYTTPADNSIPLSLGLPTENPYPATGAVPSPLRFNLSEPSSLPASVLSPFAPRSTSTAAWTPPWRKKPNQGYMGSILGGTSKWTA